MWKYLILYIIVVYVKQNLEFVFKCQNAVCEFDTPNEEDVIKIN